MKITFLKSLHPLEEASDTPKKIKDVVNGLTSDPKWVANREALLLTLPELRYFSISSFLGADFLELPLIQNPNIVQILENIPQCHLLQGEVLTVTDVGALLMYFSCWMDIAAVNDTTSPLFRFVYGKKNIQRVANSYISDKLAAIFIPLRTSKKELMRWLDEEWESIEKQTGSLPTFAVGKLNKNIALGREIEELRIKGFTFAQISNELSEKYNDNAYLKDESYIKMLYKRYVDYLSNGVVNSIALKSLNSNAE